MAAIGKKVGREKKKKKNNKHNKHDGQQTRCKIWQETILGSSFLLVFPPSMKYDGRNVQHLSLCKP
jgi:hypothetical protein